MDFKTVISSLLKRFSELRVRYGLMGGFALGLWGVTRATADLDFLVHRDDMEKVGQIMGELGYERKYTSENVSQFVSAVKLFGEVDFLHAFRQASIAMLDRAVNKDIFTGTEKIKVLRPEDLIGLKLQAIKNDPARKEVDMADIKALVSVLKENLNWSIIKTYSTILDAEDLLKEFRNE
jgi:putative nucleotidyltransferase-like protein